MAVIDSIRLGLTFLGFIILAYTYIAAGFIISALMLCSCVIWPINKTIYRIINVHLGWSYWSFYTFLGSWWSKSECYVYASKEDVQYFGKENCICIQNHRYEIDWLMTAIVAENFQMLGNHKVYSKYSHKYVPLVGWTWYFSESIFLKRNWEEDKSILKKGLKNLTEYPDNYPVTVYMYPEGTRFTEEKYKSSLEVSRSRGYPDMKHHLLPRPKGFTTFVRDMKGKFAAVYDSEIVFESHPKPSISTIAQRIPVAAHVLFKRYKLEDIPCETDEDCARWLRQLYLDKDKTFDEFINNEKLKGTPLKLQKSTHGLLNVLFWGVLTCYPLFHYLCNVVIAGTSTQRIIVTVACLVVVAILRWIISVTEIQDGGKTQPKSTSNGKRD